MSIGRAVAALMIAGCSTGLGPPSGDDKSDAAGRRVIGVAAPYPADLDLREAENQLRGSQALRRIVAWRTVAKILDPIPFGETRVEGTVPRWHTWYGKEDVQVMFQKLYAELGREGRAERRRFSDQALTRVFDWNAHRLHELASWSEERYLEYAMSIRDPLDINGVGGNHRVAYSPSAVAHLLRHYPRLIGCSGKASSDNFTACFDDELPVDAAIVKANWTRSEFGKRLPAFDTSAERLRTRLGGGAAADWGAGDSFADPGPERIYTAKLRNGNVFRLSGMHIMTKELRHWLWITLWWSGDPDTDFGADRPAELTGVWRNYKMCVVTAYDEGDADATGGLDGRAPSLAQALAAVHHGPGGPSWCSNPYLEHGRGNARTNCVGCHQHAGTTLEAAAVLSDEIAFPENGRRQVRSDFPGDYIWSLMVGDRLKSVFADEVGLYDASEGKR